MTWFTFFCLWFTAGAYYPAQPQFTPSVQAGPVIMNPAPQQPQPPPQPAQHIPTKRERKQVQSAFLIQKCATLQTLCAALRCMWYRICVLPAYDLCVSSITFAFMQNHHVSLDRLNIILNNHMLLAKNNPWKLSKRRHYIKKWTQHSNNPNKKIMNDFWNAEEGGGHTLTILLQLVTCSQYRHSWPSDLCYHHTKNYILLKKKNSHNFIAVQYNDLGFAYDIQQIFLGITYKNRY